MWCAMTLNWRGVEVISCKTVSTYRVEFGPPYQKFLDPPLTTSIIYRPRYHYIRSSFKGPFTHAIFVALVLYATFVALEFRDENRKCKLAAISMRFVAAMSQRFRTDVPNFMQLGGNLVENWSKNRRKFTLATKVAMKVQQKSHQKSHAWTSLNDTVFMLGIDCGTPSESLYSENELDSWCEDRENDPDNFGDIDFLVHFILCSFISSLL